MERENDNGEVFSSFVFRSSSFGGNESKVEGLMSKVKSLMSKVFRVSGFSLNSIGNLRVSWVLASSILLVSNFSQGSLNVILAG